LENHGSIVTISIDQQMSQQPDLESNEEFQRLIKEEGKNIVILKNATALLHGPQQKYARPFLKICSTVNQLLFDIKRPDRYGYFDPTYVLPMPDGRYCMIVITDPLKKNE